MHDPAYTGPAEYKYNDKKEPRLVSLMRAIEVEKMSVQSSVQETKAAAGAAPAATSLMRRHRLAQSKLERALDRQARVVLVTGVDSYELDRVVSTFVSNLDDSTTAVRLRQPQEDALAALGEINKAIGFDPKDLTLSDLQNVLTLFLAHQCKHGQRTVLCVEKADQQSMWLLDCIARLLRSTDTSSIGRSLMIILSGADRLTDIVQNSAFDIIRKKAEMPFKMGPFSIFETREFVRQMSSSAGRGDIQTIFDFDAIERLHRLSGGVPHAVARLFRECIAIVDEKRSGSATSQDVVKAARNLRAQLAEGPGFAKPRPAIVAEAPEPQRRLLIKCPDESAREFDLKPGRYMIGRAQTADIWLSSPTVSRRHALIISTGEAVQVLDLGGVNGTFAGSDRISEATLNPGMVLRLGDCQIGYTIETILPKR